VAKRKLILLLLAVALSASVLLSAAPARAITTNLRVGFNDGFGIYQSTNSAGNATGIHIDLMDALAEDLSFSIEYIPFSSDIACYDALSSGQIDLVLGAPADASSRQDYNFLQVDSFSDYALCLIAENDIARQNSSSSTFTGHLIAVEHGHIRSLTAQSGGPGITVYSNNVFLLDHSQANVLDSLIAGEVHLAVCEKENALQYLQSRGVSDKYTVAINHLLQTSSVILVRSGDYSLFTRIRAALSVIRSSGAYDNILEKWLSSETETRLSRRTIRNISILVAVSLGAVSLYILISTQMRRNLARQVQERTKDLRHINEVLSEKMTQLRHENDLRNNIIQNSPTAMFMFSRDLKFIFLNRWALSFLGRPAHLALDRHISQFPHLNTLMDLYLSQGDPKVRPKLITTVQDGHTKVYRCSRYVLSDDPETSDILFSVEDVTSEEQKKQSLFEMEKNRVLNTIIAGIAHEIKNPLTAIKAFSTLIPTHKNNQEFMESFSRLVPKETERINSLIESLINYARPSRGEFTTINLTELADNCIALTASLAQKAGVKPQLRADRDYFIRANRDHIQQALINYLMNAIDAIQERPDQDVPGRSALLCVFIYQEAERVFLEVYDEGIGMDEDALHQCMDPFYTTKAKGTGLGMAMAQQTVRENGGEVRVESVKNSFTRIILEFERCEA